METNPVRALGLLLNLDDATQPRWLPHFRFKLPAGVKDRRGCLAIIRSDVAVPEVVRLPFLVGSPSVGYSLIIEIEQEPALATH